jgi:hypothetical protein
MTVLGTQRFESPTVLAANGYVCVGTSDGKILVYDFRQNLQCLCGQDLPGESLLIVYLYLYFLYAVYRKPSRSCHGSRSLS